VRTEQLAHCRIDAPLKKLFANWVDGGRQPIVVRAADILGLIGTCNCPMHAALRGLHSILVHGVRDERGGYDSLYVAMHSQAFSNGRPLDRYLALVDLLVSQLDVAFRRVAAFRFAADPVQVPSGEWCDLSSREQEVLEWICQGKANADIGAGLGISPFTVKNHLRRIFRKLGVRSRFEAAWKYNQAFSEARKYFGS
jgi:DNA-binding CsgD family transcriptional regulator